ncbi:MAG: beta-lactamase family protein [Bacteroidetes bacterium]|nr:beta-lactamase family protein [Bacteroidota bacterium]MBS1973356.1 beta-lactamase family protein [Bacteroidota bacterium]
MKKIFLLFTLASQYCFSQPGTKTIDSLLSSVYQSNAPGIAIAIRKNGKTIFERGYGLADMATKEKISPESNFNIGSLTKQFTAFSILQLASKKKLSLNDKIIKFFPGFNKHTGSSITVQELLTHSSGIIDHYAFVDTNMTKHATDKDVLDAVKNIDSTYFAPGTQYRYSNTAYCLLAMIIEKLSGMRYADYIKRHIFSPLGMNKSQVLQIGEPIANRVVGYDTSQNGFKKLDADESIFFSTEGDGGIYTSVSDYLKWFSALQTGKLLSKEWIEKARSAEFTVDDKSRLSYGYGWFINDENGFKEVYHTGSNGGFRAISFSIPSKNYIMIILSNRTGLDLEDIVKKINKILRIGGKSYTKIDSLESFNNSSLIFAPCKETI